jgi:hypothetical protein
MSISPTIQTDAKTTSIKLKLSYTTQPHLNLYLTIVKTFLYQLLHANQPVLTTSNLFGIWVENIQKQIMAIYGEDIQKKGGDQVASLVHHFVFRNRPLDSTSNVYLWADNCPGQNKNKNMMAMLLVTVLENDKVEQIMYSFQAVGHTRCVVDRGFGMVKNAAARSDIIIPHDYVEIINQSARSTGRNVPVVIQDEISFTWESWWENGYDQYLNTIPNISNYNFFCFMKRCPGEVRVKKHPNDPWTKVQMFKTGVSKAQILSVQRPKLVYGGLSDEKKHDLAVKYGPLISDAFKKDLWPYYTLPTQELRDAVKEIKSSRVKAASVKRTTEKQAKATSVPKKVHDKTIQKRSKLPFKDLTNAIKHAQTQ